MILDGKKLASEILARAKARASEKMLAHKVVAIVANETPATRSYLKIKARSADEAGCAFQIQQFGEGATTEMLLTAVSQSDGDALIVQLPLPEGVDARTVCDTIPFEKDADVLSSTARAKFEKGDADALLPPVVAAIREVLVSQSIEVKGKSAVVIGEGWLVGKPAAIWLSQQGAKVQTVTEKSEDFAAALRAADLIVSGAGSPHLIKPEMIKDSVVLIDAGTSESGGQVAGDADPACAEKCTLFTPVPGGLGPIAVACLFDNATTLAGRKHFIS